MFSKIKNISNLLSNMGLRYVGFRIGHELSIKTGQLKRKFPTNPVLKQYVSLEQWKKSEKKFFFDSKESLPAVKWQDEGLKQTFNQLKEGKLLLFHSLLTDLGPNYDWVTNPANGYKYDIQQHWTNIKDFSVDAGDIKYVWEKSRFSYLYDIIRYDFHFGEDCSKIVFDDIESWLAANPINCGPNYRCSQEISIRLLNWVFALYYYKNSPNLTDDIFDKIQFSIYWQLQHVYHNINFSRIAVRNNHAITETLALYLINLYFPWFPESSKVKALGKKWFEEEVAYQIYADGTFLQFSMNYHRVVVQLLTWALILSEKNGEVFNSTVTDRATKSIWFLRTCMNDADGWLPNYGNNDGALFFSLNGAHYRDFRPQLQALAQVLEIDLGFDEIYEDAFWYNGIPKPTGKWIPPNGIHSFDIGGYYIVREDETLTFLRCGNHKDRPHQADNLHMDVWYKGEQLLIDAGSYRYNSDMETLRYFSGTASHNTVMIDDYDQMLKGGRFIWYFWSQRVDASLHEKNAYYTFHGSISAFNYIKKGIKHKRTVIKKKGEPVWEVKDEVIGLPMSMFMCQLWHLPKTSKFDFSLIATNGSKIKLNAENKIGWTSSLYGQKEETIETIFKTNENVIRTLIEIEPAK